MPENTPEIHNALNPKQHKMMMGIRHAALLLHQNQHESHLTRSTDRCIAYQETIAKAMQELGFQAHVEIDPDADVAFSSNNAIKPRGHAIGFVSSEKNGPITAFDASTDQTEISQGNELIRIYGSNKPTKEEQVTEIAAQLRHEFGGEWDETNILLGLEINQL
jgi:hypothetical protein